MGQDGSGRSEEIPRGPERTAPGTRRARRMVRRTQAQLRGIVGAGQGRIREKLRSPERILRQGEEGVLARSAGPAQAAPGEGKEETRAMRKGFIVFSVLMLAIAAADAS